MDMTVADTHRDIKGGLIMRKVLIEVSKDILDNINEPINDDALLRYIIKNGIVLDGLTNGEVLMQMFPQMKVTYTSNHVGLVDTDLDGFTDFRLDWWNAKWGE